MTITLGAILACYIFYLVIKWSIKLFLLLVVILMAAGFFYKIDFMGKITGASQHVKEKLQPSKKE